MKKNIRQRDENKMCLGTDAFQVHSIKSFYITVIDGLKEILTLLTGLLLVLMYRSRGISVESQNFKNSFIIFKYSDILFRFERWESKFRTVKF